MDWQTKGQDKLDNLPSREPSAKRWRDCGGRSNFPYNHLYRWLEANVGKNFDSVIHEFVNANWVPIESRQAHELYRNVEIHTFMENGKVWYYDRYAHGPNGFKRMVEKEGTRTFYVDPRTRQLAVFKPRQNQDYMTRYRAERRARMRVIGDYHQIYKQNGIWYEVKGKPVETSPTAYDDRKGPHDILLEDAPWNNYNEKLPFIKIIIRRQLNSKELARHGVKNDVTGMPVGKKCPKCGAWGNCYHKYQKSLDESGKLW